MRTRLVFFTVVLMAIAVSGVRPMTAIGQPGPQSPPQERLSAGDVPPDPLDDPDGPLDGPPDDGPPPPGAGGDRSPREVIGALRFWRMVDAVGLDEKEIASAMVKMKALEQSERDFRARRHESIRRIAELLRASSPDRGKLRDEIGRLKSAEREFRDAREKHRADLLASLSVEQQARYYVFEDEFPRHLMELRERARERDGRPGMGPDGRGGFRRGPGMRGQRGVR